MSANYVQGTKKFHPNIFRDQNDIYLLDSHIKYVKKKKKKKVIEVPKKTPCTFKSDMVNALHRL